MVNIQKSNSSQVAFGRKPIDLEAVKKLQESLAKNGDVLSPAEKKYLAKRLLEEKTLNELPKPARFLRALARNDGEIQNQLLNAVFTSTLAPVVIAFNPLTKKTPEEKVKTALRQPVSAINALTLSMGATIGINAIMENAANSGYIVSHDLRMNPSDDLMKKEFYKGLKKAKKEGDAAYKKFMAENTHEAKQMIDAIEKPSNVFMDKLRTFFKKPDVITQTYIDTFAKKVKDQRKEVFSSIMTAKPEDVNYDDLAKGTLKIKDKVLDIAGIPNMTKESIEKFIKKFNIHNNSIDVNNSDAVKKFVEDTMKNVGDNFSNLKKIVNPVLGIPVAIGACYVLNAIYPYFLKWAGPPVMKMLHIEPAKKDNTSAVGGNK